MHQGRYHLAEEAPISQGKLRGQFRYNATLLAARQVLEGGYKFGEDFGAATKRICEVIADIRRTVPEDSVDQIITRKIWQQKWKKKDENTASSVSTYTLDTTSQGHHRISSPICMPLRPLWCYTLAYLSNSGNPDSVSC